VASTRRCQFPVPCFTIFNFNAISKSSMDAYSDEWWQTWRCHGYTRNLLQVPTAANVLLPSGERFSLIVSKANQQFGNTWEPGSITTSLPSSR
jgi:hypothetical protein